MQQPTQASAGRQPAQRPRGNFHANSHPNPQPNPQTNPQTNRQTNRQSNRQSNRQTNVDPNAQPNAQLNFQEYENSEQNLEQNAEQILPQSGQTRAQASEGQPRLAASYNTRLLENMLNCMQNVENEMQALVAAVQDSAEQQRAERNALQNQCDRTDSLVTFAQKLVDWTHTAMRTQMLAASILKGREEDDALGGVANNNNNAGISSNAQNAHPPDVLRMGSANGPDTNGFNHNMNAQGSFDGGASFMGHVEDPFV